MKAYKFWYMMDKNSRVEYIYIIAMSLSQARQIFFDNYGNNVYDYDLNPLLIYKVNEAYNLKVGDIYYV